MVASASKQPRVLSGIQPSGNLTIGNYLGALKQWVAVQHDYDSFYCVVDLHAITTPQDPQELRQKTRESAAIYIAAGIDPDISTIFVQSQIPAHAELAWMLTCLAPLGWLHRMTQFKDKSAKQAQRVRRKIMRAVTDSHREIRFSSDPERAGVNNLLTIYQAITHETADEIEACFAGKGYGDLKKAVAEAVMATLEPLQARYHELMNEAGYLDAVLKMGRDKASAVAEATLKLAKERMGFLAPS